MDEHYLFLNSTLSKEQYPDNSSTDFTVEFPHPYQLDGKWTCSLTEIYAKVTKTTLYVCADICEESYADNTMAPILRVLHKTNKRLITFDEAINIPIKTGTLNRIRIFIRDDQFKLIDEQLPTLWCTLRLKKWRQRNGGDILHAWLKESYDQIIKDIT